MLIPDLKEKIDHLNEIIARELQSSVNDFVKPMSFRLAEEPEIVTEADLVYVNCSVMIALFATHLKATSVINGLKDGVGLKRIVKDEIEMLLGELGLNEHLAVVDNNRLQ